MIKVYVMVAIKSSVLENMGFKMSQEYIKVEDYPYLIGLRARFKNNLIGYSKSLWLKEGFIIQHKDLNYIGLSIKFDKEEKVCKVGVLNSCYIKPYSFELFDPIKKVWFDFKKVV